MRTVIRGSQRGHDRWRQFDDEYEVVLVSDVVFVLVTLAVFALLALCAKGTERL